MLKRGSIILGITEHGDVAKVLGCRTDQAGATDVDVLDYLTMTCVFLHPHIGKRIEVYHHNVNMINAVFFQTAQVSLVIPVCQDGSVDLWMQGFHSAIEDFRETGIITYLNQGAAKLLQVFCRV